MRRIFLLGVPGTARSENLEVLSDYFDWKKISTGKIIRDHVQNNGPYATRIRECFNNFQFGKCLQILELKFQEALHEFF